jgi:hypothetical protein
MGRRRADGSQGRRRKHRRWPAGKPTGMLAPLTDDAARRAVQKAMEIEFDEAEGR